MAAPHKYGADYRRKREKLLGEPCWACGAPATTADHVPPLEFFPEGEWEGELLPACVRCNMGQRAAKVLRSEPVKVAAAPERRRDILP